MFDSNTRVAAMGALVAVALSSLAFASPVQKGERPLQFVDLHYVSEEAGGIEAVREYAVWLDAIMQRHGGCVIVVHEVHSVRFGSEMP